MKTNRNPDRRDRRVNDLLMTVEEVARFAKISVSKIYHDVEAGLIPVRRWGRQSIGRKPVLRFKKGEILLWLDMGCPSAQDFKAQLKTLPLTGSR